MESDARMIEQVTRVGDLYDFYGALLTSRQREMMEMYYFDDWSLAEIATHLGVSRQAVHDSLRRATEQLEGYESTLELLASGRKNQYWLTRLVSAWEAVRMALPETGRVQVQSALDEFVSSFGEADPRVASKGE